MHSAMLSTFMPSDSTFVIKFFILSIFEWPFYTCFTVQLCSGNPVAYICTKWGYFLGVQKFQRFFFLEVLDNYYLHKV